MNDPFASPRPAAVPNPFDAPKTSWAVPPPAADPTLAIDRTTGEYLTMSTGRPMSKDMLLMLWRTANTELEKAKHAERVMRDQVVAVFADPTKQEERVKVPLGNDYTLKIAKKMNVKFESRTEGMALADAVRHAITKLFEAGVQAPAVDALVKWKPELGGKAYKALTAEQKAIIDACIVRTDGAPQVTIVAPGEVEYDE